MVLAENGASYFPTFSPFYFILIFLAVSVFHLSIFIVLATTYSNLQ